MLYIDTSEDEDYFKDPIIPESLPEYLQKDPQFAGEELLYFYYPMVPTVILGHYQDIYHEVNFPYLKQQHISVVRRNSGGGAVFVDPGDLTYVYIDTAQKVKTPKFSHYIHPILQALRSLGIDAQETGRNDLTYQGKKFSGMSFSQIGDRVLYGGTLMFNVNTTVASQVLTPSKSKLADKGIKSVHSRVTNLKPFINQPNFTISDLWKTVLAAEQRANPEMQTIHLTKDDWQKIKQLGVQKFGTHRWIYGSGLNDYYIDSYFHGIGNLGIGFNVRHQHLADVKLYGDLMLMDQEGANQLQAQLDGTAIDLKQIQRTLESQQLDQQLVAGASHQIAVKIMKAVADHEN